MISEQKILPAKLYKYVKPERIDILTEQMILLSPANSLNDPFEMRPQFVPSQEDIRNKWDEWVKTKYDILPPEIKNQMSFQDFKKATEQKNGSWDVRMETVCEDYGDKLPKLYQKEASSTFGVLCLSEHTHGPDNLLMWAHYAQSHTGLVFEFDTGGAFFRRFFIRPVEYGNERPVFRRDGDSREIFLAKSEEWRYEAEWRLFRSLNELKKRKLDNGQDGYFAELPAKHISAVFLGCQISQAVRENVLAKLKFPGCEHIRAFQAKLHRTSYKLTFSPLE
jgi:hypothetical protein